MNLIPWPYRWLAVAALAAALIGFGWINGAGHVQAQWDAAVQKQTLQAAAVRERQAQATVKVITQYVVGPAKFISRHRREAPDVQEQRVDSRTLRALTAVKASAKRLEQCPAGRWHAAASGC